MLETIQRPKALGGNRSSLRGVVLEFRGVTEHEMRHGVGVYGVIFAHCVHAGGIAAESQRRDTV
jgi:hypothetical protein